MNSFLSLYDLTSLGIKIGKDVKISRHAQFYNTTFMEIGDHVRIDDFCILSGYVKIGSHVHIAAYSALYGSDPTGYDRGIEIGDWSTISGRVSIYSSSDDFSGEHMISPMAPEELTGVRREKVTIGCHCLVGAGSILIPGASMGEGAVVGALSLVKGPVPDWRIYGGVPAVFLMVRSMKIKEIVEGINENF